jgi:predicted RNase H-like HicB family nuclease
MNIATHWHDTVEPETPQDRVARLKEWLGLLLQIGEDNRRRIHEAEKELQKLDLHSAQDKEL